MRLCAALSCSLIFLTCVAAHAAPIEGRVIDADGKAVRNAEVASFWVISSSSGAASPREGGHARSDATGRFQVEFAHQPQALMAIDRTGQHGVIVPVKTNDTTGPLTMRLGPLIGLRGKLDRGDVPGDVVLKMRLAPAHHPGVFIHIPPDKTRFETSLPAGTYRLSIHGGSAIEPFERTIVLDSATGSVDLGLIRLERSVTQRTGSRPPPLFVTDARGVGADVELSEYRGKWLLLEFWSVF